MSEEIQAQLDAKRAKIETDFFDLSIREIVRMVEAAELVIRPEYQRKFRWKESIQSALIESLLLGLPIPAIFVAANKNATWELVDGLQRIATLVRYMCDDKTRDQQLASLGGRKDQLVLSGLEELTHLNNTNFDSLPRTIQFTLEKRFLRVQVLSDGSDPAIRFQLFKRLNQGAMKLEPQEIRECVFRGEFADLLRELAAWPSYRTLLKLQKGDENNGTPEEVVLKFFAYNDNKSLPKPQQFDHSVEGFLNEYMEVNSNLSAAQIAEKRLLFTSTCDAVAQVVGGPLKRSSTNVTPVNLFEGVVVGAARVLATRGSLATPPQGWLDDAVLVQHSTKGTNTAKALEGRIARAAELLS
jgi:Protein of unknown function DUF262